MPEPAAPPTASATPPAPMTTQSSWPKMLGLLRPHWKTLGVALLAVVGETATDLLEPWPLKVIIDNLLQSKPLPPWLTAIVIHTAGQNKYAVLTFAILAVALIAVVGAVSSPQLRAGSSIRRR